MWQWVAIGIAAYAGLILLVLSMARMAKAADRSERLVFRAWVDERRGRLMHQIPRGDRRPKAA
jgi:hypothetical protein